MAIAHDVSSTGVVVSNTVLTWSHTCTGANRLLVVTVNNATSNTVVSITYDGVGLSEAKSLVNGIQVATIWYLVAPAEGANDITVTINASATFRGRAASFTGVVQTGSLGATAEESGTAQNKDINITTTQAGSLIIEAIGAGGGTDTPADGQTLFGTEGGGNTRSSWYIAGAAGLYDQDWTGDTSVAYAMVAAEFKALVSDHFLSLLGVGT